jgi:hypothetical protein
MSRHTAGPWLRIGTTVYALVSAGLRRGVEQFKNRFTIQVQRDHECPEEEAVANARLCEAAPDLLAVAECEQAMEMSVREGWPILERHGWDPRSDIIPSNFVRNLRRAAIAKATGAQA